MCLSAYEVVLFQAAFSLAYFGAFRNSELVAVLVDSWGIVAYQCGSVSGGISVSVMAV